MFTIEPDAQDEDGETRYVVMKFLTREDYNTIDHLYIIVEDDTEAAEGTESIKYIHEEGEEFSAMTAEEKVAAIKASLEADNSETNFRSWIEKALDHDHAEGEEHDHSSENRIENASRSSFSADNDLYNWAMVEERTAGDWYIYEDNGQTVFYYYQNESDSFRNLAIEQTMRSEWYKETTEKAIANCAYDEEAALTAYADLNFY